MKNNKKICWITDCHIDHIHTGVVDPLTKTYYRNLEYIKSCCKTILDLGTECVLITGDISIYPTLEQDLRILENELKVPIYFINGNHDLYYGSKQKLVSLCRSINQSSSYLKWIGGDDCVVELKPDVALIGCDGFYDIEYGFGVRSKLMMSDFFLIEDFKYQPQDLVVQKARQWAKESATYILNLVEKIKDKYKTIYIATHVPCFQETSLYQNKMSNGHWMPYFTNKILGDTIRQIAIDNPQVEFNILAGHTHHEANFQVEKNLFASVAYAKYEELIGKILDI